MRPLVTHFGDDLEHVSAFAAATLADMDMLLSDLRLDSTRAIKVLLNIQIEARKMHARAIYRAAHAVVESYQNQHKQPKIDGRLMVLYKLVVQYNAGVDEIMPVISPELSPDISSQANVTQANYDKAKATLIELLPLANSHKASLQRLMTLNQAPLEYKEPQVSFESLMPEVTDAALRKARGQGKSVSISYAAEHLLIENSQVEQVRAELDHIVERLVQNKISTPEHRQNAGLPRSGHIDVSAEQGPNGLNISILCEGETVRLKPHSNNSNKAHIQEVGT